MNKTTIKNITLGVQKPKYLPVPALIYFSLLQNSDHYQSTTNWMEFPHKKMHMSNTANRTFKYSRGKSYTPKVKQQPVKD